MPRPNSASRTASTPVSKDQVLADLEVTLAQQQRNLQINPYDTTAGQHVDVLQQVCIQLPTIPFNYNAS